MYHGFEGPWPYHDWINTLHVLKHQRSLTFAGFQLTTYQRHTVKAKIYADCSGDSILAPLTGASYRVGREAKSFLSSAHQYERQGSEAVGDLQIGFRF